MDKCLVLDIQGEWGHFRKHYTTSSPLSFSFPPRTTIAGMLGAIMGLDRQEYYKYFAKDRANLAIRLLNVVKKTRIGLNLIDTKHAGKYFNSIKNRTQVKLELVKNPCYRIYFSHSDPSFYSEIKQVLEKGLAYYTLSMGLSEYLAHYTFKGEFELTKVEPNETQIIHSVIPFREKFPITFDSEGQYFKEILPNDFEDGIARVVGEYLKVLYEATGKPINCRPEEYWELSNGEHIIFL